MGSEMCIRDSLIEYGGRQYIDEEIKKSEELPELEPSKEFDEKMHRMFQDAYKREARLERFQLGKKVAAIAVAVVLVVSAAAMNIKAVREPVLNFVFHRSVNGNRTSVCLLYTSPSPRDGLLSRMPSSA